MQKRLEEGVDRRVWLAPAVSFFVTASVVLVAFALGSFAPFGTADNSLASMDGFIQYLDFFAWYKDLLAGNNDIAYSFSKMLGGVHGSLLLLPLVPAQPSRRLLRQGRPPLFL